MTGNETEAAEKNMEILEARFIYLLMKKEYRISRSIRMQWFLEQLNKTITVPHSKNLSGASRTNAELEPRSLCEPELKVLSAIPHEQPPEWKPESSHMYKYLVTAHSTIIFLTHNYCIVYCLDMSPSLSAVDIQHGQVMIDGIFASLKKSLNGLTKPFNIPGSTFVFEPEIYVTVIAHTPFFTTPAQQVLVQGWRVTQDNLGTFLAAVRQQLEGLEDTVAEVTGIAYEQLEALRAESEKLVGGLFEESSDGEMVAPPTARVPMVAPDAGFVNMLRYGMLALRLLPESSCKSLIVVTDGVVASPDVNVLDSVLAQLRSGTVSCSFLHVGSPFHPHCCSGLVPYVDLMQFVADATCGAYLNMIPEIDSDSEGAMNIYHEKFLMWRFQKVSYRSLSLMSNCSPTISSCMPLPPKAGEWHVSNACFYGSREPHLLRKKQEEDNLATTLLSVLCCRLREGYTIKNVNVRDNHMEVGLMLPWKNHIYIDYTVSCQWPPSSPDNIGPGSSPVSVSGVLGPGLGPWVYSGSGILHYSISIEAPYEFLHDITCLLKKPFKSQYRQAVVSRFWTTLKNLNRSDQLLVHLNSFPSNPATYTIPESIRSGMPVFYLPSNSSIPVLSASDTTCPQFAQFWKPICLLEPSVWKKWLHTHRVGLVLQHDRPLPRHLHLANSSGRFQVIQCRQAAAALYSLLKDWSTFVLIENHSYVKLIHGDAEKPPTSFYIIRVTSKPPCVVINVAFLNGTPGCLRYKTVQQLKDHIGQLTFPQRPSVKEPPVRKVTSGKSSSAAYKSRQQQQSQQEQPQQQLQQPSLTQQQSQQLPRKWSDVNCCVLLQKPVEKILIRYERMPSDFGTVVFPDGTTPLAPGSQTKSRTAGGGLLTTLSRYLHHRRWVWAAQSGADAEEEAIARVLATITKMRLQEGFSFAHSTAGIINMVLEVQMKGETDCENDVRDEDHEEDEEWKNNLQPCVIQYVMFPPHMTSSNSKESGSEDDGTDDVEVPEAEGDGELQIITECWIEPQHGLVVNCPPERDYMELLPYHKLADVICRVDADCISSLLTFQHLSLMCRNASVRSPVGISPLNGVARSSPLDPVGYSPNVVTLAEQRIHYIPFAFNLMNILPKCQQAELLFSMFIQDFSFIGSSDSHAVAADAPNKLLTELLFEQLKQIHDKELQLTLDDSMWFLQLLHARERDGAAYSLPIPLPHSNRPVRKTEEAEQPQTHSYANSVASEATVCDKLDKGPLLIPKWRCFLKGISATHIVLTFVPASYGDLKLLMLPGLSLDEAHPNAVKLIVLPPGQAETEVMSAGKTGEKTLWADTSCVLPPRNTQVPPLVDHNASFLSRSSSCDTSCIFSKLPFASHLRSDSCSPLSFDQHEVTSDPPFRMRASSWDTVTKRTSESLDRIRTGSIDSKIKVKHPFVGPSLRLRDVATDVEESKGYHEKYPFSVSQKVTSAPPKPSPDLNSEHVLSHFPKYGAITLPMYVYDCPLAMLMDVLVYRDTDTECGNKVCKDIYQDRTFKLPDLIQDQKQGQVPMKEGTVGIKLSTGEGTIGDREQESDQMGTDKMVTHTAAKHTSPEPKSEDSDGVPDIPSLSQHCKVVSLAYYKVFVSSLFKSLHLNNTVHALDVQAAVDECEEALIEIDITNFLQTVCGHLKDFCMKARVDEMKQRSNDNSPQHEAKPIEINGESGQSAVTDSNPSLDRLDLEPKFPLLLLQTHAPCQQLELLHKEIKAKFTQILTVTFRPVPSHPDFYFCTPNWEKNQLGKQGGLNADDGHIQKPSELDDELDSMTYHSEIVEFRSEHGIVGIGTGAAWEGQGGLVTPDDARTSLLSNMDSDSVSDLQDEEASEEVSPLFLHLTCSVRSKGKINSCSVHVLPTCLGELVQSWDSDESEVDLKELQVTLDILCLTLPDEVETDVVVEDRVKHLSKVSPLFSPCMPRGEECDGLEADEREANRPGGSVGSGECSGSPDPQLPGDRGGHSHLHMLHQLKHLAEYQLKAVTTSVEKIEWLMRDEIAAFLLDTFPLDKNTLVFVANHVASSPGRPSCLLERVPLQFVFGPEQSLEHFLRDFRNLSLNGYHLCEEGQLYYLVRDKHSASATASDPVTLAITGKKSGPVLLPTLGMKLQPGHVMDHAELWSDMGCPPTAASGEDSVLVSDNFLQTIESNVPASGGKMEQDDSDTDENSRPRDQPRPRPKPKHLDATAVKPQGTEGNCQESNVHTSLDTSSASHITPQLENTARSTSGSDDKHGPDQSPVEAPSPTAGPSPHEEHSFCEISSAPDGPSPKEIISPENSPAGITKLGHNYDFGDTSSRNGDIGGESDKTAAREASPTRWCAVTAWQRRQQQQQQQQGTPGHRSEVSSIVESALDTEDGYEGYAGDSSDSADECDWLQDLDMRRPSLPKFWLIMKVNPDAVTVYFHCRCSEGEEEAPYRNIQRSVVASIKRLCKVVNQTMLLQNLHDTRMCDQLLEQETSEDIWKTGPVTGQVSGSDALLSRAKSLEESQRPDGENEPRGSYLEATLKFMPGWFACSVMWEAHFILHPRLKTGPGKPGFSRGIQALHTVLNRFSVNNRKNMFVYQDTSGNVFYLRLHENVRSHSKSTPPGGLGRSDTEDNLPGPVSRSSSIASLNAHKHVGSAVGIPITSGGVPEEVLSQRDGRPRVQSFGEKELCVQTSSTGLSSLTGLSSSEGNATTPTPCVTPQPVLARPEDTVILKVHGISEAGPEVKEDLVQVLQNRLNDAVLEVLSVMLARNPMCKLTPDDVHFIQKPFKAPEVVIQFSVQSHALPHLQALAYYLRQNLLQFLYIPKYTDPRPECHFQDYSEPETSAKRVTEGDLFLYNQSPVSGSKGIACIAVAVVDGDGNLVQHQHYPKPYPAAHLEALNHSEFASLTLTKLYEPGSSITYGPGPVALLEFRVWKQGRVNNESLTQKLQASVQHATWDLLMEFRLLTAPLAISCPSGGHASPSPSPSIAVSASVSASVSPSSTVSSSTVTFLPVVISEPSTPSKAKKVVRPSDSNSILERTSNLLNDIQIGSSGKACKLDSLESGETGVLHKMYHTTLRPWFEFGVELGVPAVRKHTVTLTVRHSLAVMVRELQNLVNLNAGDTTPLVFWGNPFSEKAEDVEYIPGPFMGPNFSAGACHTIGLRKESSTCLLLGRNLIQWKACVAEDTGFDPDLLDPKNAQKVFQKFSPLLMLSEQPPRFVPRQRLLLATLSNQKIVIYTYNWSKERVENLHQQATQLGHWLSARSSLLTSIITQKMGLFHNQELTRKQHTNSTSGSNSSLADNGAMTGTLSKTAAAKSLGRKVSNPYLTNLGDIEQLVKFPVGVAATHKDSTSRRVGFSTSLGSAMAWRDVFRDGKPRRPISKTPTNTDAVVCHVQQMLETRQFDRKAEEQKKLYVMWQTRGATPNIPLAEDIIHLFKQNSRVIHYCLTPLLFLPRWRVQSAATRDHALSSMTSTPSAPVQVTTPSSASKGHHSHHSRHPSGNSSASVPGAVHAGIPSPTLHRHCDDKWHSALCANFVHEYKQYLQTLGFIPIQTEPSSPGRVLKGGASNMKVSVRDGEDSSSRRKQPDKENNVCYLQKSLLGGILLFEILLCKPFFHAKLHALECSRLQSKSSSALISQFTLSFLDECDKIKVLMHLHSFTYDYHLRSIHSYVSGHQAILKQGYHLTHFLDDFLKYYSKAPNFARNLVHADVLTVHDVTTPACQLFNYLLGHGKAYNMEVFRMVPVPAGALNDSDCGEYDTDSEDNEYVLVQVESTPHVTYRDDFDATLIVAHDRDDESDQSSLHIKYYIILTSRRELYPKLEVEPKLGKFCTVSTASVTTPLQLGHAGCTGELDNAGVGSETREWHGSQGADSNKDSLHTTTNIESELQPELEPKAEPELEPNAKPELEPKAQPELEPNAEPELEPKAEPELEPNAEPELEPKAEPELEPKTEPDLEPNAKLELEPKAVPELEPKAQPELEPNAEPEFEPNTESEHEPKVEPQLEPEEECESNHEHNHDADSSSEKVDNSDPNPDQMTSLPTPTHHIEIRQEAVNYLGYYSSHEQLMQQLILEQADSAMQRICSMVSQGMVHCRTHLLWNKLQCSAPRDWERRRDRDREEVSSRDLLAGHGLTYSEFCELRNLAIVEPLSQLDPRLSPLLCQPLTWYQSLAKVLVAKYVDHCRTFIAPDGNVQHIVILHPRYVEAFMMLSIDLHSSRGDLAVVYQKALANSEQASSNCLEFSLADIQALVEGFVNACCFHLWVGLL